MTSPFFMREYTCPLCKTNFSTLAVRSSAIYVERKESDFHTIYRGLNPLYYSIIVCPSCEYAASSSSFAVELSPKIAEQIALALSQLKSENSPSMCGERDAKTALYTFQLAIRTAQLKKAPPGEIAGLLLASAWIAREIGNHDLEYKFLKEALNKYMQAFTTGNKVGNLDEVQLIYLIGELNRRLGNYREAVNWFNKVITHKNIKNSPNIEKMAREQWSLAREEMQKNKTEEDNASSSAATETAKFEQNVISSVSNQNYTVNTDKPKSRPIMQMPAHLYDDQIEWLRKVSNQSSSKNKLFTREEVLRALLDAVIQWTGENLPQGFATEEELKQKFKELLAIQS
ncbi:DUF2225 domain-containing protein [Thermosyntropha sp.]|uniref:DUF2225 domain-containing protein n=1 Tax=Thermosyntropha sp. TaxID=2740820 RepID=UPI0025E0B43D|nr:DUF2225 domain-containing protein [Thermosyntropha sp.]MBO8158361.1 DUF2225 domain-containing protein [Thermosyntropha sp.]